MTNKIQTMLSFSKTIKFNQSSCFLIFQQLHQRSGNLNPGYYEYTKKYQLVELQSSWHSSSYKMNKSTCENVMSMLFWCSFFRQGCTKFSVVYLSSIQLNDTHTTFLFCTEKRHSLKWKKGSTNRCEKKTIQIPKSVNH